VPAGRAPARTGRAPGGTQAPAPTEHSGYITYHGSLVLTKLVHRRAGLPSVRSHTGRIAAILRSLRAVGRVLTSRRYITYGPARSVCVGPAALFQGFIRGRLTE